MASQGQMTGMLGVYLTAVELVKRGFIVSPTSRSAIGADLLVTDQRCKKAWSVQVKTNAAVQNYWLVSPSGTTIRSPSHIYVHVNVSKNPQRQPQFFVISSRVVADNVKMTHTRGPAFYRNEKYRDNWKLFGDPRGAVPARKSA